MSFACPQVRTNNGLAGRGQVYGYQFADQTAPPLIPAQPTFQPGASHASELFYLFDIKDRPIHLGGKIYSLTDAQKRVADRMVAASSRGAVRQWRRARAIGGRPWWSRWP